MEFDEYLASQEAEGQEPPEEKVDPLFEMQQKLKDLEERAIRAEARLDDRNTAPDPVYNRPPPPEPEPDVEFTSSDLIDDPDQFNQKLSVYAQQKMKPLMESLIRVQARQEMHDAVMRHPYLRDYEDEATAMLRNASPAELANSRTWDTVALMIKEKHFDDIRSKTSKTAPPNTNRSRSSASDDDGKYSLTPEEKFHARMIGVKEEDYAKSKEAHYGRK